MKRVVVVHCWDGTPDYCWYPWLKRELESKGFEVHVPAMPETNLPKQSLWVPKLAKLIGEPDENLILVGHSIGCATIMRYLEGLEDDQMIGGAVLVAGFSDDLGLKEIHNFFESPINFEAMKAHCTQFVAINSDDDPYVDMRYAEELKEKLGAEVRIKHTMKHFSGPVDNEDSCTELPDVAEAVIQMSK